MISENKVGSIINNYYGEHGAQETARKLHETTPLHFYADTVISAPAYRYTDSEAESYTLFYFKTGGKGYFRVDNEVFHPGAGDAVFVSIGQSFDLFPLVTQPWEFTRISFQGSFYEEILKTWRMPTCAHIENAFSVAPFFDKIITVMRERHVRYTTMTDQFTLLLLELIQHFTAAHYKLSFRMAHPWAHALRHSINNSPEDDVDNKQIAARFGCSVTTIVEIFRASYGMTPHEYRISIRLEKAALMLRNSAETVERISEAVGFHDSHYFCRAFKKHYSQTPSEYRRAVGNSIRKNRSGKKV